MILFAPGFLKEFKTPTLRKDREGSATQKVKTVGKAVPPSMTLSALSRDTSSLRAAGSSFWFLLIRVFVLSFFILTKAR
jgi:hypothetical protein